VSSFDGNSLLSNRISGRLMIETFKMMMMLMMTSIRGPPSSTAKTTYNNPITTTNTAVKAAQPKT
jgi:hypothetical protein